MNRCLAQQLDSKSREESEQQSWAYSSTPWRKSLYQQVICTSKNMTPPIDSLQGNRIPSADNSAAPDMDLNFLTDNLSSLAS